jgi:hypothetical protein
MDRRYGPSRRALCRRLDAPPDRCGAWGRPQHGGASAAPRRRQIASWRSTAARRRYATDSGPARSGHVYGRDCCSGGNECSRGLGSVSAPGSRSGRDTDHTETGLRSSVEDRWREAARAAGRGASIEEMRAVDPDLVEHETQLLGWARAGGRRPARGWSGTGCRPQPDKRGRRT